MAILFTNVTPCPICSRKLKEEEQVWLFPAFVPNAKDPLYPFNDAAFHLSCLKEHVLGNKALELADQFILKTRPENRICSVGGNGIQKPEDYLFIGLLTSNNKEELYACNFTTLDRNNLEKWTDRDRFVTLAFRFRDEDQWGDLSTGNYLDSLIESIKMGL